MRFYINGVRETDFGAEADPSQNLDGFWNSTSYANNIGQLSGGTSRFDGLMSHLHFIDGTVYDASSFGSTDATTGSWKINTSPSVTYGTNGFFILKDGNSVTDQSGNSNNLTASGTLTNTEDCPSNVFATLNPLSRQVASQLASSPTNGNTTLTSGSGNAWGTLLSTIGASSGKYYCEAKLITLGSYARLGICDMSVSQQNSADSWFVGQTSSSAQYGYNSGNGNLYTNAGDSSYGNSFTAGDIIGIAMDLDNSKLTITSSDLETTMISEITTESSSNGQITIPSKILIDTLKTFSNQPLTFLVDEETKGIEISSENGNYKLAGQDAKEFPKVPELSSSSSFLISSSVLLNAINKTLFASGNDELRPVMSGVFCELSEENITFVATDAHKLVKHTRSKITSNSNSSFILPKKPLSLLKNNIDSDSDLNVDFNETNVKFSLDNITLICRLIDGKYPNYDAVIPKDNPNKLVINKDELLNSIKRVSIYASKTTHQIRLKIAGSQLQITSEDLDFANKAEERLTCSYEGEDIEIGFNSRFVIDMLNNIGAEQICLEMSAPNRAGIILPLDGQEENEDTLMLVMPVMLN